ncbi:hypothetical protein [Neptunomonas antarctica]|uniref:Uncharacterized protein n=1 Tax=Neptunomonas antarctica TaxID=619304 RepID=A0A1N7M909_9GAMM|nr:hypothetical protein [Neptunomonas antarctica]SIS82564.1 hypothetical protein SAMN05421760_105277 [Neptunomonas antarctica]
MLKKIWFIGIILAIASSVCHAEYKAYDIDGKYRAVFGGVPIYEAELGAGSGKHRSYSYTDENSLIIYTATYQIGKTNFTNATLAKAIKNYVHGQSLAVGGSVLSYMQKTINGNQSAIFEIQYKMQGVIINKYAVVSYKNGHFYQWAIQELPVHSKLDGNHIFNTHLKSFLVH